jgi:hypothetical protein
MLVQVRLGFNVGHAWFLLDFCKVSFGCCVSGLEFNCICLCNKSCSCSLESLST